MPAYSFSVFEKEVERGVKRQTIRLPRKRETRVGEILYLFWKQRTKMCHRLGYGICTSVFSIVFDLEKMEVADSNGRKMSEIELLELANMDGFACVKDMFAFFKRYKKSPLSLEVIRWKPFKELWK